LGGELVSATETKEHLAELRAQVCSRCISRRPGGPPCGPLGVDCGIEQHVDALVAICRFVDSSLIDPYLERMMDEICANCEFVPFAHVR
jgi:hypothetical protein